MVTESPLMALGQAVFGVTSEGPGTVGVSVGSAARGDSGVSVGVGVSVGERAGVGVRTGVPVRVAYGGTAALPVGEGGDFGSDVEVAVSG